MAGDSGAPLPPLNLGGAAGPSGVSDSNAVRFGNTYISAGNGGVVFWLILAGAGFLIWKKLTK